MTSKGIGRDLDATPNDVRQCGKRVRRIGTIVVLIAGLAGVVVSVVLLAGLYRRLRLEVIANNPPIVSPDRDWNAVSRGDDRLFWALNPNLEEVNITGVRRTFDGDERPMAFVMNTNEYGLRGGPIGEKGERFRILAVGDSTTFGDWVDDDETWSSQLQAVLEQDGKAVEVINAGVSGYSSFQGLRYLEEFGLALDPDMVIATFGHNDYKPWDGISDYERAEAMDDSPKALTRLIEARKEAEQGGSGEQRPRLTEQEFIATLAAMKEFCASRGIAFALLAWPMKGDLVPQSDSYLHLVHEAGRRTEAHVIDLLPAVRRHLDVFIDGCHYNAKGCGIVARTIAAYLREHGLLT